MSRVLCYNANIMAKATRPPIVAVMGHIDHGKSSLLDYIRKANVTASEAGGITQHVSAYEAVHTYEGEERHITFLDTPGHEAFRTLRARGAAVADVAILVIAAEEGVKPQTLEAFGSATEANIPIVVAFTKIDKNGADIEKAKVSALENSIYLEGLGGSIAYTGVSSKTGEGVPELLDLVLLTTDLAELTGDADQPGEGFVLESSQDPKQGMQATLILKDGTIKTGSFVVAGSSYAPVRFIENFAGARIASAGPSTPIRVAGWSSLPLAGTPFITVDSKKEAEKVVSEETKVVSVPVAEEHQGKKELALIIKADVSGSIEAIHHELNKVDHERVHIRSISEGIGAISEADVKTALAGGGTIIGFNVSADTTARDLAERSEITLNTFTIIYDLKDFVEKLVIDTAPKVTIEEVVGEAKVLKAFNVSQGKAVLGAKWVSGILSVGDLVKLDRRGVDLGKGRITNMQQARSDIKSLHFEGEFGIQIETKAEVVAGDTIISFKVTEN